MLKTNDKAPDFCLKDQNEESICLHDFLGQWVVIYFYPKDDTPGCTIEAIDYTFYKFEFEKANCAILGISADSCSSHKSFVDKYKLNFHLLSDPDHKAIEQYGAWKPKKMFGMEYFGIQRSTFLINPEGKIAHIWPKVKAKGHAEDVKQTLLQLM